MIIEVLDVPVSVVAFLARVSFNSLSLPSSE